MTTATQNRTTTSTTTPIAAPVAPAPRRSVLQVIRDRQAARSDLSRAIAAYPATRSAAVVTLPQR
ncbi:MAG: hypothetical protein WA966_08500 [Ornithinimicrobium sp.]